MEGRKTVGGKLEVKIRVRDPFKSRQVDEVKEKWLVIDQFIKTTGSKVNKSFECLLTWPNTFFLMHYLLYNLLHP